jgi:quercetin dioxygenase-like cupin family protein
MKYSSFLIKHKGEVVPLFGDGYIKQDLIPLPTIPTKGELLKDLKNIPPNVQAKMKVVPFITNDEHQIHMVTIPKGAESDPHFHTGHQIRICAEGVLEIQFIGGDNERKETIYPGEYIVIPELTPYFTTTREDYTGMHVTFKCKME